MSLSKKIAEATVEKWTKNVKGPIHKGENTWHSDMLIMCMLHGLTPDMFNDSDDEEAPKRTVSYDEGDEDPQPKRRRLSSPWL